MLHLAVDSLPNQSPPVLIAAATTKNTSASSRGVFGTTGVCMPAPSLEGYSSPIAPAYDAFLVLEKKDPAYPENNSDAVNEYAEKATVEVLQPPMHGVLKIANIESLSYIGPHSYQYTPTDGYKGNDKAVFLVNIADKKVEVIYFFKVVNIKGDGANIDEIYYKYCPNPYPPYQWVISLNGKKDVTQKALP